MGREYVAHLTGKHSKAQWANGAAYTNTIEGFFATLRQSVVGTHHSLSRKHLHRYVSEVAFKYNTRHLSDGERTVKLIQACDHRRLT